jgi:hypothetical protein
MGKGERRIRVACLGDTETDAQDAAANVDSTLLEETRASRRLRQPAQPAFYCRSHGRFVW